MREYLKIFGVGCLCLLAAGCRQTVSDPSDIVFDLTEEQSHEYFIADINGDTEKIMAESGLPALLIGQRVYEKNLKAMNLRFRECEHDSIRLALDDKYEILYKSDSLMLKVGKAEYRGPVFILKNFDGVYMPIQYLVHPEDGSSNMFVDLQGKAMKLVKDHVVEQQCGDATVYEMTTNDDGCPMVNVELSFAADGKKANMKGDFIMDLGNGSLLYLMKQNGDVRKMLDQSGVELLETVNGEGKQIAQGIYAEDVNICGRDFSYETVVVTDKMKSIRNAGFLGLKFFKEPVLMDFDKNKMFVF